MKPIIGIIGTADYSINNKDTICVFENYRKAIIRYGGIPIGILPSKLIDYYKSAPKENSKLFNILKEKQILVNSFHDYKVKNSGSYEIAATCNNVIEVIEKNRIYLILMSNGILKKTTIKI